MYPSLVISAQGGLKAFLAGNWFNIPTSLFGTLIGGITQPLLQGKMLKTQYEIAKVNREKVVLAFKKQVLVAFSNDSNA